MAIRRNRAQPCLEIGEIIVAPHDLVAPAMPNTLDHRCVVELVREDHAARQEPGEGGERRDIGQVARIEQKRRRFAVEIGKLRLKLDMHVSRARDVAGAARAGADIPQRLVHGLEDGGMLAHCEIVVGAPNGDIPFALRGDQGGFRKIAAATLDVGEFAITPLRPESGDGSAEYVVMHLHADSEHAGR